MGSGKAVRIIFDTDIGTDVDDAGALAILPIMADRGEAEDSGDDERQSKSLVRTCPGRNQYLLRPGGHAGRLTLAGQN